MHDVAKLEASLANPCRAHKLGLKTVNATRKLVKFVCKVNLIEEGLTDVDVFPDWVVENFYPKVIATLCKEFLEKKPSVQLFMDVGDFGVNVPNDKQFYQIWYVAKVTSTHYLGMMKGNPKPTKN